MIKTSRWIKAFVYIDKFSDDERDYKLGKVIQRLIKQLSMDTSSFAISLPHRYKYEIMFHEMGFYYRHN